RCAQVIISFGRAGALRMARGVKDDRERGFRLCFDPRRLEGDWEESSSGKMIGYTISLAASIARELLLGPKEPDLDQAIQPGVAAQRRLFEVGYGKPVRDPHRAALRFHSRAIAAELAAGKRPIEVVEVPGPLCHPRRPLGGPATWTNGPAGLRGAFHQVLVRRRRPRARRGEG